MARRSLAVSLAVALLALGGTIASAYWTATSQLPANAKAASTGLDQVVHPTAASTPLHWTYDAANLATAGAVSITNTGSRGADYTLSLISTAATVLGLPGAISVAVAPVADAAVCAAATALDSPTTGVLSTSTPFVTTGSLAASTTIVLCVQTSMAHADATTYTDTSTQVAMHSELQYAPGAVWHVTAPPVTFSQAVGGAQPGPDTMVCGGSPYHLEFAFSQNPPHQSEMQYRAFLAQAATPNTRIPFPIGANGWWTMLQIPRDAALAALGPGNAWAFVEQRVGPSGEWAPAGHGRFSINEVVFNPDYSDMLLSCGWM